jgi:hypothetical protein
MPSAKRSNPVSLTVDGISLLWSVHREQQWCTADRWKGVAILVTAASGGYRELFLEYPTVRTQKKGWTRISPAHPKIVPVKVEIHVRHAMAAGWDPSSRGKPFVYQVPELPS